MEEAMKSAQIDITGPARRPIVLGVFRYQCLSLVFALLLVGSGCVEEPSNSRLRVFAASSLAEVFTELRRDFLVLYPDTEVSLSFAGSQVLRLQIEAGARADVFASANSRHMGALKEGGEVSRVDVFAQNELVLIVPTDNPAGITQLRDLPMARRVVLGAEGVPVGTYTREMLKLAGLVYGPRFSERVLGHVVSRESNVRLARAKVELGEADAAVVYRTDALASDEVRYFELPTEVHVRPQYLIGLVGESANLKLARAWSDFVLSPRGAEVLKRFGFNAPGLGD